MPKEILKKEDTTKTVRKLLNVIATRNRFVNCFGKDFIPGDTCALVSFLATLRTEYKKPLVLIDVRDFFQYENQEDEARAFQATINMELREKGIAAFSAPAISIAHTLDRWNQSLEGRALVVFHCFHDPYSEGEKNTLRSIRQSLRDLEKGSYLALLIISSKDISHWELLPETNIDERHVELYDL